MKAVFKNLHPSIILRFAAAQNIAQHLSNYKELDYSVVIDGLTVTITGLPDPMWVGPFKDALGVLKKVHQVPSMYVPEMPGMEWHESVLPLINTTRLSFQQALILCKNNVSFSSEAKKRKDIIVAIGSAKLLRENSRKAAASLTAEEIRAARFIPADWIK